MSDRVFGDVGSKKLFENDRVVVWEMRLAPGENEQLHRHDRDYVMIQIAGDRVAADFEPESRGHLGELRRPAPGRRRRQRQRALRRTGRGRVGRQHRHRRVLRDHRRTQGLTRVELLVGDVFANAARADPDRLALAVGDDRLTFGELDRGADEIAGALCGAGIGAGDRVVVVAGTASVELAPLFAAAARHRSGVRAGQRPPVRAREPARSSRPRGRRCWSPTPDSKRWRRRSADACGVPWMQADWRHPARGAHSIAQRISASSATAPPRAAGFGERSPHVMFFTSGSTGRPKACGAVAPYERAAIAPRLTARAPRCTRVPVPDVPHGGVDARPCSSGTPATRGAVPTRRRVDRDRDRRPPGDPRVPHPRGLAPPARPRGQRRNGRSRRGRVRRHRHLGHATGAARRDRRAVPGRR